MTLAALYATVLQLDAEEVRFRAVMADPRATDIGWGFASARLAYLDVQRDKTLTAIMNLEARRRRRMLRVPLRRSGAAAAAAVRRVAR